jgi:HD superfamily phosphodiesterase
MMKTEAGRRMAQRRHAVMEQFLRDFLQEWDAAA